LKSKPGQRKGGKQRPAPREGQTRRPTGPFQTFPRRGPCIRRFRHKATVWLYFPAVFLHESYMAKCLPNCSYKEIRDIFCGGPHNTCDVFRYAKANTQPSCSAYPHSFPRQRGRRSRLGFWRGARRRRRVGGPGEGEEVNSDELKWNGP
jgi:hypothetical protein